LLSYLAVPLYLSNLSLIALTLHALTEVTTIFLLALLAWFIANAAGRKKELGFIHRVLLMLVLLTVIKPLFYPLVLFVVFIILPVFYFRQYRLVSKKLITLLLVLSPLLLQQSFMKIRSGVFKVSMISEITLRDYLFAQCLDKDMGIDRDRSLAEAKKYDADQVRDYLFAYSSAVISIYKRNLENNCNGYPIYLDYPAGTGNPVYLDYMIKMNGHYYKLHRIMMILILLVAAGLFFTRKMNELFILVCSTGILYYILLTSGISAYQYDRLTICAFPVWIFIYLVTLYYLSELILFFLKKRSPPHL
jgi:hypothetical protein